MSKGTRSAGPGAGPSTNDAGRRVRRLERRLAAAREVEAKRRRQAANARDREGARDLQAKRARQVEKARRRGAALEAELRALASTVAARVAAGSEAAGAATGGSTTVAAAPSPAPAPEPGPSGYCLRDRRTVELADPTPFAMRNGRPGMAGTCPHCGARVVRPR